MCLPSLRWNYIYMYACMRYNMHAATAYIVVLVLRIQSWRWKIISHAWLKFNCARQRGAIDGDSVAAQVFILRLNGLLREWKFKMIIEDVVMYNHIRGGSGDSSLVCLRKKKQKIKQAQETCDCFCSKPAMVGPYRMQIPRAIIENILQMHLNLDTNSQMFNSPAILLLSH